MTHDPDSNITMPFGDERDIAILDGVRGAAIEGWKPTGRLKFVRRDTIGFDYAQGLNVVQTVRILHQEWIEQFSGKYEWRVVPEEAA